MPSTALRKWKTVRSARLDEIQAAHASLRGPGSRSTIQQLNYAYALLLASEFQGFCRDLHSEAADRIVATLTKDPQIDVLLKELLTNGRLLDKGNANPSSLGSDFGRLQLQLWPQLDARHRSTGRKRAKLEELNAWRNAIAHHDFRRLARVNLRLAEVQSFRAACNALGAALDEVVGAHLTLLVGLRPW